MGEYDYGEGEGGNEIIWSQGEGGGEDLGYYHDGVKRTLTDAQIAIFRHSEIQEMLSEFSFFFSNSLIFSHIS